MSMIRLLQVNTSGFEIKKITVEQVELERRFYKMHSKYSFLFLHVCPEALAASGQPYTNHSRSAV